MSWCAFGLGVSDYGTELLPVNDLFKEFRCSMEKAAEEGREHGFGGVVLGGGFWWILAGFWATGI